MWSWDVRDVPAAESGREYETVEARCRACVVNGGDEGMCISAERSLWWQQERGRPCPRIELDPRNIEAMTLISWCVHEDIRPLAPQYARLLLRHKRPEDREAILARVAGALRSEELMRRIHPTLTKDED